MRRVTAPGPGWELVAIEFGPESGDLGSSMTSRRPRDTAEHVPLVDSVVQSRVGTTIKGKYLLERVLGVGGMAAVYAATHRNRKQFAIKVLHPEFSMREDIRKRFLREGYVANSVRHGGAVAVLDDDVAEDGSAFLVMELLDGIGVEDLWIERAHALDVPQAMALVHQLLDVLSAAHAQGVLHRDIKPANLFLTRERVLKVLDFGIARLVQPNPVATATATGTILGTPAFMPPEQAFGRSGELDGRSDLWAVGATLFVLISGQVVHEGENSQQLIVNAATRPARPFASVAPGAPRPVAELIDRALAFAKQDRWQSAGEMRAALERAHVTAFGCEVSDRCLRLEDDASASVGRVSASAGHASGEVSSRRGSPAVPASEARPVPGAAAEVPPISPPPAAPAAGPPRADGPAPLAAAHIEVNIASNQLSGAPGRLVWLAVAALLGLLVVSMIALFQRAPVAALSAAPALSPAPASPAPAPAIATQDPVAATPAPAPASEPAPAAAAGSRPGLSPAAPLPSVRPALQPKDPPAPAQPPRERVAARPPPPAECARLLELQSLGETLSPQQRTFLRERCKG